MLYFSVYILVLANAHVPPRFIPWNSGKLGCAWYPQAGMVLHHAGVEYHFDYDFAPNDGTEKVATSTVIDGQTLDGEIFITDIWVGEKRRPVTTEVLGLMWGLAAREELRQNRLAWQRLLNRAAEQRRAQISLVPRRG